MAQGKTGGAIAIDLLFWTHRRAVSVDCQRQSARLSEKQNGTYTSVRRADRAEPSYL
ncbi:MAG: hypothetical protein ACSHXY_13100 [Alphaproteobacteria bacterium]